MAMVGLFLITCQVSAQNQSPEQTLAAMEKCREQVINGLSLGDKLKMRAAMGAIQANPELVSANNAVTHAATPQAQIEAKRALAKVKLDLLAKQDPSLSPIIASIRAAQSAVLK